MTEKKERVRKCDFGSLVGGGRLFFFKFCCQGYICWCPYIAICIDSKPYVGESVMGHSTGTEERSPRYDWAPLGHRPGHTRKMN